jgi:hypothetical protein
MVVMVARVPSKALPEPHPATNARAHATNTITEVRVPNIFFVLS